MIVDDGTNEAWPPLVISLICAKNIFWDVGLYYSDLMKSGFQIELEKVV